MDAMHDIFLSHSHRDELTVKSLADKLVGWGFDVYVDYTDPALQDLMDRDLADRLKNKIRTCRVFLFAFSSASARSKWMPWELGLAHGVVGRVVLWPLDVGAKKALLDQEYLKLYDSLEPSNAEAPLKKLIDEARNSSVAPAHLAAMENLAAGTMDKGPLLGQPDVFTEFVINGPARLYIAWINALMGKR